MRLAGEEWLTRRRKGAEKMGFLSRVANGVLPRMGIRWMPMELNGFLIIPAKSGKNSLVLQNIEIVC